MLKRVCVFCGSNVGGRVEYRQAAEHLGQFLAQNGIGLVYGGGNVGLMGVLADAALAAGGEVIGVIPQAIVDREIAHRGVTELRIVPSMHARKALMADLSDGFIALPGGFGTFDEFCEVLTWSQLGIHKKPCGLLNVQNYFAPLLVMFDHALAERFVRPENRQLVLAHEDCSKLIRMMEDYEPVSVEKWITSQSR